MGRHKKIKTADEMTDKIEAYFESCWAEESVKGGSIRKQIKPYTICGLASFIGIDRKTLLVYQNLEEYRNTIKKAKNKIEAFAHEQLYQSKNVAGIIFDLKNNYGWRDQTEITGSEGGPIKTAVEVVFVRPGDKKNSG